MDSLSPEFARYWLATHDDVDDQQPTSRRSEETPSASQREAFAALAERVVAARTIL